MSAPFPYQIRCARNNTAASAIAPDNLRVVWVGYADSPAGGADLCYIPSFADDSNGNETARLITDALDSYLLEHPERMPASWVKKMCAPRRVQA